QTGAVVPQPAYLNDLPAEISPITSQLLRTLDRTRNVILYGPPGTGKTFHVTELRDELTSSQLEIPRSPQQLRAEVMPELTWHDSLALAMFLDGREWFR